MDTTNFLFFLAGLTCGLFVTVVVFTKDRSEERNYNALFSVDEDGHYRTDFDHPRTKDRLRNRLDGLRTDPTEMLQRTFTDDGRFNWVVHSEYHMSLWLLGEWLQYWPTKAKFRWNARTYTGDVTSFIEEQLRLHQPTGGSEDVSLRTD